MSSPGVSRQPISPDCCTWCAHPPHQANCPKSIQTDIKDKRPVLEPCPCKRNVVVTHPKESTNVRH